MGTEVKTCRIKTDTNMKLEPDIKCEKVMRPSKNPFMMAFTDVKSRGQLTLRGCLQILFLTSNKFKQIN